MATVTDEAGSSAGSGAQSELDLVIVGAGPAGMSAGIYARRAGLSCLIFEKGVPGGQVLTSPIIENYPGFPKIEGMKLMDVMADHARKYVDIREGEEVTRVAKVGDRFEFTTASGKHISRAILLATGSYHKKLEVPGESQFSGRGVSYCATCDGFFFKERNVMVVGGGNTALTDALHLDSIGCSVTVVHRRDTFRADKHLQESISERGITVLFDTVVVEIMGDDVVSAVRLRNVKTDDVDKRAIDGIFVAVGELPSSQLASELGVEMDPGGFVEVDKSFRTNVPFIYAAGDVSGGIRQIVAAVHGGAAAALSAFEDLANPYYSHSV
ncbi:MAG: FAD-dependent oxidoreductase [Methanobacteriota archaeon]|nr:MAG: FAD-dependent oxidoreductase [Euryarchaeota archaeon]